MKRFRRTTLLLVASPLFLLGGGRGAARHEIKIAVQAPERSAWGETLTALSKELEKETGGQVRLKVYWSGVQGNEATVLRKIRIGQLDAAGLVGRGLVEICPDSLVLNLPLLFEDEAEAVSVLEQIRPTLEEQCRAKGFEILGWPQLGFSYLFSTAKVDTVEALRRSRPWLMENDPLVANLYEVLKVTPVSVDLSDVLTGLQSGLVRTIFSPPALLIAMQWHSRVRYRLDLKMSYSFGNIAVSRRFWDRLPGDLQTVVKRLFEKRNAELNEKIRRQNREALEVIASRGNETISPAPESREQFARATLEVGRKMAGTHFSRETLDRVQQLVKDYRHKTGSQ